MMFDTHTHTAFSHDSKENPETLIKTAIDRGLTFLAITEHLDLADSFVPDLPAYFSKLYFLREKYPAINLAIGIECGFEDSDAKETAEIMRQHPFEYVINSVHTVNGRDCYFAKYFEGRSKKEAYEDYYRAVERSVDAPFYYDTIGHLGYIVRNAPYADRAAELINYREIIDAILLKIIKKDKILEINSNIRATESSYFTPDIDVLRRYRELGGKLLTFASDAHRAERLVRNYMIVTEIVKGLGFKNLVYSKNKQIIEVMV